MEILTKENLVEAKTAPTAISRTLPPFQVSLVRIHFFHNWRLPKGWFSQRVVLADGLPRTETGTRVHSDVPPERKLERGYVRMFPRNENRNEGTFAKTIFLFTKPPFYLPMTLLKARLGKCKAGGVQGSPPTLCQPFANPLPTFSANP